MYLEVHTVAKVQYLHSLGHVNQETVTEGQKLLDRCLVVPADLEVANPNRHFSFVLLGFSVVFAVGGVDNVFLCTLYGACRVALHFSRST
jgi:hypothetical protein